MIHATGRGIDYAEHEAPLSIKCVLRGKETHAVRGVRYEVDDSAYLILNHGQRYSSHIARQQETETFSIFFAQEFARQALRSLVEPAERLLDEPDASSQESVGFVESLYPLRAPLAGLLEEIRRGSDRSHTDESWLGERLCAVLDQLLRQHGKLLERMERLPALRASTRLEQYRRLRRARDFIDADFANAPSLDEISRVACLSRYHLLRLFKNAFGLTPHQYLTRKRLNHARILLQRTELPVSEICTRVGYESLGSFSRLFSKRFGVSPSKLRNRSRTNRLEKRKFREDSSLREPYPAAAACPRRCDEESQDTRGRESTP